MEHPEILPLIVIVIGVLLSSRKKPKQTLPPAVPQPEQPQVMPIPCIQTADEDKSAAKSAGIEAKPIPAATTKMPELPTMPKEPKAPAADSIAACDDAYSSIPHPDVPVGEDWRRAIIAHEILKRKF